MRKDCATSLEGEGFPADQILYFRLAKLLSLFTDAFGICMNAGTSNGLAAIKHSGDRSWGEMLIEISVSRAN